MNGMPAWEEADERLYEARVRAESFEELVDRLMQCDGLDRDEAEIRATAHLSGVPESAVARAWDARP